MAKILSQNIVSRYEFIAPFSFRLSSAPTSTIPRGSPRVSLTNDAPCPTSFLQRAGQPDDPPFPVKPLLRRLPPDRQNSARPADGGPGRALPSSGALSQSSCTRSRAPWPAAHGRQPRLLR